jgi:hypothetical protein
MLTGIKETAYRVIFSQLSLLYIIRRIVAPNATIIIATEKNRNVKPIINLLGSICLKSLNRNGDDRIERKVTTAVKAKVRESTSATVKTTKNGLLTRTGTPVL